jgi:hypothetical protein
MASQPRELQNVFSLCEELRNLKEVKLYSPGSLSFALYENQANFLSLNDILASCHGSYYWYSGLYAQ